MLFVPITQTGLPEIRRRSPQLRPMPQQRERMRLAGEG